MKKLLSVFLVSVLLLSLASAPAHAAQEPYTDLPADGWAREAILSARELGLMDGMGDGTFGVGRTMSRAQFVTVLARMFRLSPDGRGDAYGDISKSWARDAINACARQGVTDRADSFFPDRPITRREMSVWLVRALGYADIAELSQGLTIPFTDVSGDRGYIAVAYDIGMTNGVTPTTFAPEATATREQVAAMLVRVYERYIGRTAFTHAFYAISSYSQLELAKRFDAVSFGWGRMELTGEKVRLNTTADNGNEFCVPAGYEGVVRALRDAGVKLHLSVFMDTAGGLADLLADPALRTAAVDAILAELTTPYKKLGDRPYTGVTLDFEGLRAAQRADYTAFLRELDTRLEREGLTLYVSVQPATADGVYYDGYDYRAIGELADKVILMAHDYSPRSMEGFVGTTYYKNAALTPIRSVYCSLRAVCDPATGVQDRSKLVLAISCTGAAWEIDGKGLLVSPDPVYPSMETIYSRMVEGGRRGWSQDDRSPHMQYAAGDGRYYDLWYEDERSVSAKIDLAQMFGVSGVSFWRLGTIPNYPDDDLQFDVMRAIN